MVTEHTLLQSVSSLLTISARDILGKSRRRGIADARAVYAYLLRTQLGYSFPRIGRAINCNHSGAYHMVANVNNWLTSPYSNPLCAKAAREIIRKLTDKTGTDD